jgi:hypothetical protein
MASLSRITGTFFVNLINRLAVRPPPPQGFELSSIVQPVSIVDSDIQLSAILSTLSMDLPATGGEITSPAALSVLADTGQLAAGTYNILAILGTDFLAGGATSFRLQRRDAANAVNVWTQLMILQTSGAAFFVFSGTMRFLLNERLRIQNNATTATNTVQASIWTSLVTAG